MSRFIPPSSDIALLHQVILTHLHERQGEHTIGADPRLVLPSRRTPHWRAMRAGEPRRPEGRDGAKRRLLAIRTEMGIKDHQHRRAGRVRAERGQRADTGFGAVASVCGICMGRERIAVDFDLS